MKTSQMSLHGLRDLKMDYIRVIRHMGLTDVKGLVRVRTDALKLKGQYEMNGEVLSFIPISGMSRVIAYRDVVSCHARKGLTVF